MNAARALFLAASLALSVGGAATLTRGLAVPVKARVAQHRLGQQFEARLAANVAEAAETEAAPAASPSMAASKKAASPAKARIAAPLPVTGPIARISVDRLGVEDIVLAGAATHEQLALGPTMLKRGDAASPVTVLAAHRDTHFLFIRDLREGDEVTVRYVTGEAERYRVTRFETVRWDAFAYPLDPARPLLALSTCYPFGGTEYGGPWRRVAWAERIA
ncbi:MAG TPA: class D sortase [Novosphingobium sp.]|nr:class D sortase [Novosphingobium sp.]